MRTLCIALLLAAAGCKEHEPEPPPPSGSASTSPTRAPVQAPAPAANGVALVSAGAEPRRALRYHLTKGATVPVEMASDVTMNGTKVPTIVFEMAIAVDDVLPDGSAKLRTTIVHAGARDRPGADAKAAQVVERLRVIEGVEIAATLSPDGTFAQSAAVAPGKPVLSPRLQEDLVQLGHSLEEVSMPLPREPVGAGARWTIHKLVDQGGAKLVADTAVELVAIDGDRVTYKSTATFTGAPQKVERVDIAGASGTSESHGTLDLGTSLVTAEVAMTFAMKMAEAPAGEPSTISFELATRVGPPQGEHKAP